jgi:hypothetical protein
MLTTLAYIPLTPLSVRPSDFCFVKLKYSKYTGGTATLLRFTQWYASDTVRQCLACKIKQLAGTGYSVILTVPSEQVVSVTQG